MTDSILNSIKKLLGIAPEQNDFDTDIIVHLNAVFSILSDLGVGPEGGFSITDSTTEWNAYIPNNPIILEKVKTFMYLKVRLYFDPPTNSFLLDSMKQQAAELEWRLTVNADKKEE